MSIGIREACRQLNIGFDARIGAEFDAIKAGVFAANFTPEVVVTEPLEFVLDGALGSATTAREKKLVKAVGEVDLLVGGPPCQGHSDLNNHTRRNDDRNSLVTRMARFAELFEPTSIVIENVQGIRHDKRGASVATAKYLGGLGYQVEEVLLDFNKFGVPQSRRRYMLIATRKPLDLHAELSGLQRPERTVAWAIADLVRLKGKDTFNTSAVHSPENTRRIEYLFQHDLYDLPNNQRPDCHRLNAHSYVSVYGRMRWDRLAPTITTGFGSTGQGRFVHPLRPRTLTPREAARLQTIPDFFTFGELGRTQLQKMIGNSVPPLAMCAVATTLLR